MLCSAPFIWQNAGQSSSSQESKSKLDADLAKLSKKNRVAFPTSEDLARVWANPSRSVSEAARAAGTFVGSNLDIVALGLVTGIASGLVGIGGGLVMNSYMASVHPSMPQHEVIATSLLVAVPIGLSGSLVHFRAGRINPLSGTVVAGAALVATGLTSRYVKDVDDAALKRVFTGVLVASSLSMLK